MIADDRDATLAAVERRPRRPTCWSSPAASRSGRTTTSSPRSRRAASRRSSGGCGSSPASRCGSAAAATRSCSACRATRCRRSSASACSSSRRCGACRARRDARAAARAAAAWRRRRGRPTGARRSSRRALRPGADGVLEATPTERQGSHMTGALGESDGFAVAPDRGRRAARRRARRRAQARVAQSSTIRRCTGVSGGFSPRSSAAAACRSVSPVPVRISPINGGTSDPQTPVSQDELIAVRD